MNGATDTATHTPTGAQLLRARRRAKLSQADVARAMGAARQRVALLESMRTPTEAAALRYLAAVAAAIVTRDGAEADPIASAILGLAGLRDG